MKPYASIFFLAYALMISFSPIPILWIITDINEMAIKDIISAYAKKKIEA